MNSLKNLNRMALLKRSNQLTDLSCGRMATSGSSPTSRSYCDKKEPMTPEERIKMFRSSMSKMKHMDWVTSFGVPNFRNKIFTGIYLFLKMPRIDPKFDKNVFIENCREATIIFCNLISERSLVECEQLMTSESYAELCEKYKDAPDEEIGRLYLTNKNIDYHNLIFLRDYKQATPQGERLYVEATLTVLKKSDKKELSPFVFFSDLIITRFIRDYTNGPDANTDWIISYFDHKWVDSRQG